MVRSIQSLLCYIVPFVLIILIGLKLCRNDTHHKVINLRQKENNVLLRWNNIDTETQETIKAIFHDIYQNKLGFTDKTNERLFPLLVNMFGSEWFIDNENMGIMRAIKEIKNIDGFTKCVDLLSIKQQMVCYLFIVLEKYLKTPLDKHVSLTKMRLHDKSRIYRLSHQEQLV